MANEVNPATNDLHKLCLNNPVNAYSRYSENNSRRSYSRDGRIVRLMVFGITMNRKGKGVL